ncbi:MAG: DUF4422 domain-containing protein [Alphaproteobacteria bacterium]|nr:DUF4422 domain-containing protein [Alphaproteobacteria bacterium]
MIQIYSCNHKPYQQIESNIIIPIHVGKAQSNLDLGFIGDDTGDNISSKNPYFCELTATYWIWKNIKTDIVGLFHYRRFLNFANTETKVHKITDNFATTYGITEDTIKNILKNYDIIVPNKTKPTKTTVYDFYAKEHFSSDMDITLDIIKEKYPSDYDIAQKELKENSQMFVANMLVANKAVFDCYAKWLFSILFEVEKRIQSDVLKRNTYQQRVYGFLAERLMGVFIATHKELKVKHLPMLFVEEDEKKYKKYKFKQLKRKILTILGLGKKEWQM